MKLYTGSKGMELFHEVWERELKRKTSPFYWLRAKSPDFPMIHKEYTEEQGRIVCWLTTMVQFEHEGKMYKRHHAECVHFNLLSSIQDLEKEEKNLLDKLLHAAEQTMLHGVKTEGDEPVSDWEWNTHPNYIAGVDPYK